MIKKHSNAFATLLVPKVGMLNILIVVNVA
jgi:hypothetical protein